MSFCRWSSDDFHCDLYCYEDCYGGFTTHIAVYRVLGKVPKIPFILDVTLEEFMKAQTAQHAFLEKAKRKRIDLPYTGESFNDSTLEAFYERLQWLREIGYKFPDYVLSSVLEEIEAEKHPERLISVDWTFRMAYA